MKRDKEKQLGNNNAIDVKLSDCQEDLRNRDLYIEALENALETWKRRKKQGNLSEKE